MNTDQPAPFWRVLGFKFKKNLRKLTLAETPLKENLLFVLHMILLILGSSALLRLTFLFYNYHFATTIPATELIRAFLVGVRFDLAAFAFFNFIPVLLLTIPHPFFRIGRRFYSALTLFLAVNLPLLLVNAVDVIYYRFSEKRSSYEFLIIKKDITSFPVELLIHYFWLLAIFLLLVGAILLFLFRMKKRGRYGSVEPGPMIKKGPAVLVIPVVVFLLLVLAMRGGLQMRALRPAMAFFSTNIFSGHLASNSAFNLVKSLSFQKENPVTFYKKESATKITRELIHNDFDGEFVGPDYPLLRPTHFKEKTRHNNVVLIIMESFNGESVGTLTGKTAEESLSPQFDQLSSDGLLCTNYISNAKRSIEAFPAILNSLPDILPYPIISSSLETNNTWGVGNILQEEGYRTLFFHGGRNGSMGLENYSVISGFQKYYGLNEYEKERGSGDFDGSWGIYDDKFFDYFYDKLSKEKGPYLATIFSLSNHHPYKLPEKGWEDLKNSSLKPYEKTFRYADAVLGRFFDKVKKNPAFKNTIFIVTADHFTFYDVKEDRSALALYHIPLLIYAPGLVKSGRDDRIANHLNLLPTVIDLLKIKTYHSSLGRSLLQKPNRENFALLHANGVYAFVNRDLAYLTNFTNFNTYYKPGSADWEQVQPDNMPEEIRRKEMEFRLKAIYQSFHNALIDNRIIPRDLRKVIRDE